MALKFLETARFKFRALTGANPVHEIGTGFADLGEDIDALLWSRLLHLKVYSASATVASGELAAMSKTGETLTLPSAVTANQIIGLASTVASTKIKCQSGQGVYGGSILSAVETATLGLNQCAVVFSDGANWLTIAGSFNLQNVYVETSPSKVETEAGIGPSSARNALVTLLGAGASGEVLVGGIAVGTFASGVTCSFMVPAGLKWKSSTAVLRASTLLL